MYYALADQTVWNPDSGDDSWAGLATFQMGEFCISYAEAGGKAPPRSMRMKCRYCRHNMQDYFQETYGRKTRFIPNGINRPILKGDSEIKAKYGLEKDGYILFLARIVPEKGLHYLLHAFEQIETDKKLVIAAAAAILRNTYRKWSIWRQKTAV